MTDTTSAGEDGGPPRGPGDDAGVLTYVGVEAAWAFPTGRGNARALHAAAATALSVAAAVASLPSALDPFSVLGSVPTKPDPRAIERIVALGRDRRDAWVRFARADGSDAAVVEADDFAKEHVRLAGHPMRFARIVGPVRHVGCTATGRFRCGGSGVDDIAAAMRRCAVSVGPETMHSLGDPLGIQVLSLAACAADPECAEATVALVRRHVDALRNLENGASSRGIATDLHAYDVTVGGGTAATWSDGLAALRRLVSAAWPLVVASEATIGMCRAIDAPVSIFARVASDDVADLEAREEYRHTVETLCDRSDARAVRTARDLAHVSFALDDAGEAALRFAAERFLGSCARRVAQGTTGEGQPAVLHEAGGSRYLTIEHDDCVVLACWSTDAAAGGPTTLH